jgi:hypothetical protein
MVVVSLVLAGCRREPLLFSESNARAHVSMLAGTIGSRAIGTPENARARAYVVDQLQLYGFDVRVQEADARRPELGRTARVANVIATLQGSRSDALGLVAHYDSAPEAPGAADDGLGVAVVLEAARVYAARPNRPWTLMVLVTDGEEAGLMGAAALMTDREVTRRLKAYLQVEAAGSDGPALLFETGPANGWIVGPWARRAPHPRGASFAIEIYKRLPNDTDFSIIKRQDIPGLNFAPVGDSYAYHTARDTPERLSSRTLTDTGENLSSLLAAFDTIDITARSPVTPTYFDLGGVAAVSYGPVASSSLTALALVLGVIAWVRTTAAAIRTAGLGRWLMTIAWSIVASVVVVLAMIGVTWALRAAREVYHPWYAHPDRLFVLMLAVGVTAGWCMSRLGQWLPPRAHGLRHPVVAWTVALPLWIVLASIALWLLPGAAYLWTLPLLTAGILLTFAPLPGEPWVRAASVVVLAVAGTLWLRDTVDLMRFIVAVLGRLPIVTPVFVYAAIMSSAGLMLAPPFIAVIATTRPLLRPSAVTALCLMTVAVAAALAYRAPAYTHDQPLRRYVRALQNGSAGIATWEVASLEPGLDLGVGAPGGWTLESSAPVAGIPWGRLPQPFVFRTSGPSIGPPPVSLGPITREPVAGGIELSVTVTPQHPGITVSFVLPAGLVPARHNLPGLMRLGRWTAVYVALPAEGVLFRASFPTAAAPRLTEVVVVATSTRFPGGEGWQSLPAWIPQDHAVWGAAASWALTAPVADSAPLR